MFARYSRCTGETLRSMAPERSSGRPVSGLAAGSSGTRRVGGVGDDPHPVGGVERAGLGRDVAGRVAQAEEGLEVGTAVLGDDLAVPLGVEAVDHHPVEAGDRADVARQHGGQLVERGRGREPLQHRGQPAVPGRARLLGARRPAPTRRSAARRRGAGPGRRRRRPSRTRSGLTSARSPASPSRRRGEVAGVEQLVEGAPATGRPNTSAAFAEATTTARSGSVRASRAPCGWIAPGMAIGSSAQSSSACSSTGRLASEEPATRCSPRATLRARRPGRRCWSGSRRPTPTMGTTAPRSSRSTVSRTGPFDRGATTCSVDARGRGLAARCARARARPRSRGTWWA